MPNSKNKAITLVELILAILLISTIVLAGYSLELTLRNMSVAPRVEAKVLDELIPIMEMIKKSFEFEATGNVLNAPASFPTREFDAPPPSCSGSGENGLEINVGGVWQGYCWKGTGGPSTDDYEFWFYEDSNDNSLSPKVIGKSITNFAYDLHDAENRTRMSVEISAMKDPANHPTPNPFTNPEVTLNQTFYSRAVSGS